MKNLIRFVLFFIAFLTLTYFWLDGRQEPFDLTANTRLHLSGSFIKLSDGWVHYEYTGPDDGEIVILLNGAGCGYYAWDSTYDYLVNKGFKVLRYDAYGRGYSERIDKDYTLDLFVNQLQELQDVLHIRQPVHLISVSAGAAVATSYWLKDTLRVKSLIFADPAALGSQAPWYIRTPFVSTLLMTFYWRPRAVQKQMLEFYDTTGLSTYRSKTESQMKYKGFKDAIRSTWEHTLSQNLEATLRKIGRSKTPVLLIWGKEDPLVPINASAEYLKMLPQAQLKVIDKAGHLSPYEQPDVVNPILVSFLNTSPSVSK